MRRLVWLLLGCLLPAGGLAARAVAWRAALDQPAAWYATGEARAMADNVLLYQDATGGWPKNRNMALAPAAEAAARQHGVPADETLPTIDNGATHTQLRFLARIITAGAGTPADRAAFDRGIAYLLAAQYPNGGWPQFYPLRPGYYSHITFNDDAMAGVLGVLHGVAQGREPFAFASPAQRAQAAAAVARGVACILRCQVVIAGKKTAWCAQHDEHTFAPAPARKFEPATLSGLESVGLVRFLMAVEPTAEVVAAIEGAVAWFEAVKLTGLRYEQVPDAALPKGFDTRVVPDPTAPPLWARFYELGTNRSVFTGRDGTVRYRLDEIEAERRGGYAWYVSAPEKLLTKDYAAWRRRLATLRPDRFGMANPSGRATMETSSAPMSASTAPWVADLGDGRYRNPVIHADYSDPDVVRVGDDFWMTASSFGHAPGLPLLHSRDLVNWNLTGHALPRLVPEAAFRTPQHGKGVWAPSIRHHDGKYWIYYPDPDFGLYVITATDPRGPWSAPVMVRAGRGLIDPCPLWDDDGQVWLVHAWAKSRAGINNRLTLLRLGADGTRVEEDCGVVIDGDQVPGCSTLEGPKLYRRNGWYYIFAPAGGVADGWQSVFRARDIRGPYEHRVVLARGQSPVNGPHQGALVDTPAGEWWFLHFQDKGPSGRIVHLQPVAWRDDWPLMGTGVTTGDATGEPVLVHAKPALPSQPIAVPATSDDFSAPTLAPQWQWQANPAAGWHALGVRPGVLRLIAQPAPKPDNLYDAPHLLMQKFPALDFTVTTQLEFSPKAVGESAGLIVFGYDYAWLGLRATADGVQLVQEVKLDAADKAVAQTTIVQPKVGGSVWLRVTVTDGRRCQFACSTDGKTFAPVGDAFTAKPGRWVGAKVGLFALGSPPTPAPGWADFHRFTVTPPL
ncbi:MAG: hypothetical protein BroJett029_39720 [Alphaproteobacteria bacterium]|nr:MAG: hypothetical protein BroJett029_39720 [Alphaproteobacteria bacterium]